MKCIERGRHTLLMIKHNLIDKDRSRLFSRGDDQHNNKRDCCMWRGSTVANGHAMWLVSIFNKTYL